MTVNKVIFSSKLRNVCTVLCIAFFLPACKKSPHAGAVKSSQPVEASVTRKQVSLKEVTKFYVESGYDTATFEGKLQGHFRSVIAERVKDLARRARHARYRKEELQELASLFREALKLGLLEVAMPSTEATQAANLISSLAEKGDASLVESPDVNNLDFAIRTSKVSAAAPLLKRLEAWQALPRVSESLSQQIAKLAEAGRALLTQGHISNRDAARFVGECLMLVQNWQSMLQEKIVRAQIEPGSGRYEKISRVTTSQTMSQMLMMPAHAIFLPLDGSLSLDDFTLLSAYPIFPIGVSARPGQEVDGQFMGAYDFTVHDFGHAKLQSYSTHAEFFPGQTTKTIVKDQGNALSREKLAQIITARLATQEKYLRAFGATATDKKTQNKGHLLYFGIVHEYFAIDAIQRKEPTQPGLSLEEVMQISLARIVDPTLPVANLDRLLGGLPPKWLGFPQDLRNEFAQIAKQIVNSPAPIK